MKSAADTTNSSRAKGWWLLLLALLVAAMVVWFNLPTQKQLRENARLAAGEASRHFLRPPARPKPYYRVDQPAPQQPGQ